MNNEAITPRLQYIYAKINLTTGECRGVCTSSVDLHTDDPSFIIIPHLDEDYVGKYYINGAWYEDAAGTIPWAPAE